MENNTKNTGIQKVKIGVSGAAETGHCGLHALDQAKELGVAIVKPRCCFGNRCKNQAFHFGQQWVQKEGVFQSVCLPAANEKEHVNVYKLPLDYMDLIIYTGFGYPGRDLLFTRSCDAIVVGCGRIGTIHEFFVAFEDGKPIGVLEGDWDTDDTVKEIIDRGNRTSEHVIYDTDAARLITRLIEMVKNKSRRI